MENLVASIFAPEQMIIVLVIVVLLFGGAKIPELMRGVGRGVGELQKGLEEGKRTMADSLRNEEASAPSTTTTTSSSTNNTVPK